MTLPLALAGAFGCPRADLLTKEDTGNADKGHDDSRYPVHRVNGLNTLL